MNAPILSSLKINLPTGSGKLDTFVLSEPRAYPAKCNATFNRVAYSAAHVVADAQAANDPWLDASVDWEQTLRYREYLWVPMTHPHDQAPRRIPTAAMRAPMPLATKSNLYR